MEVRLSMRTGTGCMFVLATHAVFPAGASQNGDAKIVGLGTDCQIYSGTAGNFAGFLAAVVQTGATFHDDWRTINLMRLESPAADRLHRRDGEAWR